jgi:rhodanese-related sulfurtransferase
MHNYNILEATIVDVRTEGEFAMGKVDGSINIPLSQVPNRVEEFRAMPRPLVLICQSGNRSGQAARFLQAHGLTEVYNGGGWLQVQHQLMSAQTAKAS